MREVACKNGSQASIAKMYFIGQLRGSAKFCKQVGKKMGTGKFAL
jgi:hypothetical protein